MGFHATIILDFPDEDIIVGSCWIKNPPCEPSQNNKPTSLSVKKDKWNENPLPFFALNTLYHPKVLQTFRLLIQILLEIFNPSRILFGVVLKYSRTTFLDRNLHQCTLPILHFFLFLDFRLSYFSYCHHEDLEVLKQDFVSKLFRNYLHESQLFPSLLIVGFK